MYRELGNRTSEREKVSRYILKTIYNDMKILVLSSFYHEGMVNLNKHTRVALQKLESVSPVYLV